MDRGARDINQAGAEVFKRLGWCYETTVSRLATLREGLAMKGVCLVVALGAAACGGEVRGQDEAALRLVQTVPLPGVSGRIDHMDVDLQTGRLFVAALGNGTVEVVDLRAGQRIRSVGGFEEPQ